MDTCFLCKSSKKDDVQYGDYLMSEEMHMGVHTFCLYLSSNLSQNGDDDEGFLGFLEADIRKEELRVSHLKCFYCNKKYANIGCCEKKCRHTFHLVCGIENGAENQFCKSFQSYCRRHRRKNYSEPPPNTTCLICYENLREESERKKFDPVNMIQTPCCRNGFFHKLCLQKFAKTAGYFFKCPLCNDSKVFRQKLPAKGIFIPNQDAAWELEPNAFADLLERPNECSALECENKHGRSYSSTNNPLMLCSTCGSTAIHRLCLPPPRSNRFHCADCTIAMEERDSGRESLNSHPNTNDNELDEIDVCNVSDHENLEIIQALFVDNVPNSQQEEGLCSSDDEIRTKRQRKLRILSSESDSSNISKENMKPSNENTNPTKSNITTSSQKISGEEAATNSTRRKVLYAIEEDEVEISHNSRNRLTKIRTPSRVMVADIADSSDAESDCIPRRRTQISTKSVIDDEDDDLQTELEEKTNVQSHNNYVHKQEKERKLSTSTEDDLIIKPHVRRVARIHSYEEDDNDVTIPRKQAKTEPKNEASIKNSICSTGSRSKIFNTIDDSDEDETSDSETISEEQKTDSVLSESASDESEEDDDPLENFTKLMEKQKNISCVARRTRSAHAENHHQKLPTKPSCSSVNSIKPSASMKKTIRFKQPNQNSAKSDNLDISCIAKRTRRKSMFCERTISEERCSNPIQNTKQLEISCVALRTRGRRETVCSETFTEKNKHEQRRRKNSKIRNGKTILDESDESSSPYQVSQIYEKEHETDDDLENVVVPDNCMEYENSNKCKLSALEISCIANRTRKHKSVKPIEVIDEESSSSCYSISSSSTCGTDLVPSRLSRYNEKFPNQSVECFKSKTNQQKQQSYHPSNYHHPHINNRRRI